MKLNKWAVFLAGILSGGVMTANAQTIEITMGGSSAGTGFATQVPLELFLPYNATTNPIKHYVNGAIAGPPAITSGRLHVWTGVLDGAKVPGFGGQNGIIRYAATGSADGVRKLQSASGIIPVSDPASNMTFLNHAPLTGCTGPTPVDINGDSLTDYEEFTGCTATVDLPLHLGASDTHGSSFHQVGPVTTVVRPLPQDLLTSTQAAIVPFKIVLGNGVKKNVGGVLVQVDNLTQSQVEALFSRQVTDWRSFGYVPDVDNNGVDDTGPAPVTLCLRTAGSGSKATFDETMMVVANETTSGSTSLTNPAAGVYFGGSTQDVRDCIGGNAALGRPAHPLGAGYVDADAVVPNAYDPKLEGFRARDLSLSEPRANVMNGFYRFWVGWRLNQRPAGSPGISAGQDALMSAFVTQAQSPATIAALPSAGDFWVAPSQMCVQKNNDRGPIAWKSPIPAGCPK